MTVPTSAPERGDTPSPVAFVRRGSARISGAVMRGAVPVVRGAKNISRVAIPFLALIGRVLGPRLSIVSTAGWLALALAAASLIAGYTLGWQELTYVGFTIVAGMLVCTIFLIGRSTYGVTIELSPSRVVVGQRALGRMAVTNNGSRGLLPARMELPVGQGLAEFAVPSLTAGEEHEELFSVPTNRRAVIVAGPAVSVRGDQLGLLRRVVRWTDAVELFVHPETVPLAPSAAGLVRDLEGQVTKKITNNDISFHALRTYEPGDDRRYVHWRTSARTGTLMVRQFEETRRSQLTIVHSEDERYYADADEFELGVSVMASIATQVIRDGTQISVVSEHHHLRSHTPHALLDDSCRLDMVPTKNGSAREFARRATRKLPPPSVLVVIAGSKMTTTDHRSIQLLFPGDATMISFRIARGESPALQLIAGMQVATIGELGDVPKVLRRAGA